MKTKHWIAGLGLLVLAGTAATFSERVRARVYASIYSSGSDEMRSWSVERLAKVGPSGAEPLIEALRDPKTTIAEDARRAIADMDAGIVTPALIDAYGYDRVIDLRIRSVVLQNLGDFREPILKAARDGTVVRRRRAFGLLFTIHNIQGVTMVMSMSFSLAWRLRDDIPGELNERFIVYEDDYRPYQSEAYMKLYREGLKSDDPETVFLASLIWLRLKNDRKAGPVAPASELPAGLLLAASKRRDPDQEKARFETLTKIPPEVLRQAIAADPACAVGLLRLFEVPQRRMFDSFVFSGCYAKLSPLIPEGQPQVEARIKQLLDSFRRKEAPIWPRAAVLVRDRDLDLEPYLEALSSVNTHESTAYLAALDALKRAQSDEGRAALRSALGVAAASNGSYFSKEALRRCTRWNITLDAEGRAGLIRVIAAQRAHQSWALGIKRERSALDYAALFYPQNPEENRPLLQILAGSKDPELAEEARRLASEGGR